MWTIYFEKLQNVKKILIIKQNTSFSPQNHKMSNYFIIIEEYN